MLQPPGYQIVLASFDGQEQVVDFGGHLYQQVDALTVLATRTQDHAPAFALTIQPHVSQPPTNFFRAEFTNLAPRRRSKMFTKSAILLGLRLTPACVGSSSLHTRKKRVGHRAPRVRRPLPEKWPFRCRKMVEALKKGAIPHCRALIIVRVGGCPPVIQEILRPVARLNLLKPIMPVKIETIRQIVG